jgi:hypothetical protein
MAPSLPNIVICKAISSSPSKGIWIGRHEIPPLLEESIQNPPLSSHLWHQQLQRHIDWIPVQFSFAISVSKISQIILEEMGASHKDVCTLVQAL